MLERKQFHQFLLLLLMVACLVFQSDDLSWLLSALRGWRQTYWLWPTYGVPKVASFSRCRPLMSRFWSAQDSNLKGARVLWLASRFNTDHNGRNSGLCSISRKAKDNTSLFSEITGCIIYTVVVIVFPRNEMSISMKPSKFPSRSELWSFACVM